MEDTAAGIADVTAEQIARRAEGEPTWLRERRLRAWEVYQATPMPTTRGEEWRYTDPALLRLDAMRLGESGPAADFAEGGASERPAAGRVVMVDGQVAHLSLEPEVAAQGVVLARLAEAADSHRDLVEAHLAARALPPEAEKFAALSGALWQDGVFLYVPKGVRVERPIRAVQRLTESGLLVLPRTLIIADEGAHVAYVDDLVSADLEEGALVVSGLEIFAREAAHVQYVAAQQWGRNVRQVALVRTIAERDADLDTLVASLGGSVCRVDLQCRLEGPGSRSDMLGVYFAEEDQHFDHFTRQDHVSQHAGSDLLYKGALYDRSHTVFRGLIRVHPGAQRTDAYQTNRNLILSPEARAESLPNLEIEADDVRCSHGATVGQLEDEELFYLMTRGLPRRVAERLVVAGFLGEVLDRLPLPEVVEELRGVIERKIG
jgi:Fe-S cluster assembly protein SufD